MAVCKPGRVLTRNSPCRCLDLGPSASRAVGNKRLLSQPRVCSVLLQPPRQEGDTEEGEMTRQAVTWMETQDDMMRSQCQEAQQESWVR